MPLVGTGTQVQGWAVKGDDDRVELVRRMTYQALTPSDYPSVLWSARSIIAGCPEKDDWCELNAIFNAVHFPSGKIPIRRGDGQVVEAPGLRFVTEARQTDSYPSAKKTLDWLAEGANGEDCDGITIFIASLLMVTGWLPGCVIASTDGKEFVHIFPVAGFPKDNPSKWVALDTTVDGAPLNWWPNRRHVPRMRVYGLVQDRRVSGREI
jgi:hypothetical protein